ncbi:MAG TPA: hypothetical protein VGK67_35375 [Myxococcales bacterium]|jgi:hypothetical protein
MARFACLLALLLLAACPQEIDGPPVLPLDPPDASTPLLDPDTGTPLSRPDSGEPVFGPDAGRPDTGAPSGPDAALLDLGACTASPSPARLNQAVTISCPPQASMSGPTWSVEGIVGVDGGYALAAGSPAGTATFTLGSVPKNFPDSTLKVRATWHGGGGDGVATAPVSLLGNLWVAKGTSQPAIAAFTTSPEYAKWGGAQVDAVGSTEFDSPPRALGLLANGDILVAQTNKTPIAPPVIVIGRTSLARLDALDFDAKTPTGEVLFDQAKYVNPRAVMQMTDGTVWVTGGPLPVIYGADGKYRGRPTAPIKPSGNTAGLAQLSNGQVAVSMASLKIGLYRLDGSEYQEIEPLKGGDGYSEIQAILALAEGGVVLSLHKYLSGASGGLLVQLDASWMFVRETPQAGWTYQEVHPHVVRVGDEFVATPELDAVTGATLYRYGADLARLGTIDGYGSPHYTGIVRLR